VDNTPGRNYKGFDIYPLVYPFKPPREWHERRRDRAYSASVVICREGVTPETENQRVFRLEDLQWENVGIAKRAAMDEAVKIIDGLVPGQKIEGI
jgi:hypothetical protein